nr:hypothetical protein [uncultured Flavobacterium sp.]
MISKTLKKIAGVLISLIALLMMIFGLVYDPSITFSANTQNTILFIGGILYVIVAIALLLLGFAFFSNGNTDDK